MTDPAPGRRAAPQGVHWLALAAGLLGAAGVSLAAIAAHKIDNPGLATAAMMLVVHAAGVLAIAGYSAMPAGAADARLWRATGALMAFAVSLFSGAVAYHAFTGVHVFPRAAPIGGSLTILSWLVVAGLGALGAMRGARSNSD